MKIAWFGSSLVSAYWNGAATYYRGIIRALSERGHEITFYQPDAFERQQHRDLADPAWASVVVYSPAESAALAMLERAAGADLVVKASGVGVNDALLEREVLALRRPGTAVAFWDVDAPATLERLARDPHDPFAALIPRYDLVLTCGGGAPVTNAYLRRGARQCVPIYNALDPTTHHPVPPEVRFAAALGFIGNRLPDREERVDELFFGAARRLPGHACLLGGAGWGDKPLPGNVRYLGHVHTEDHNAFNASVLAVLNVSRAAMASYGFSPATRVFEAAGAGACLITDAWVGIDRFLEPGREVLVARDGADVAEHVAGLTPAHARAIGERAYARIKHAHTYAHRALDVEAALAAGGRRTAARARGMKIVVLGLSITSSWGNGHATTYRGLVRELAARGHDIVFLERDLPWYAQHRDIAEVPRGRIALYASLEELHARFEGAVRDADLVIVGSYVPQGVAVARWVLDTARGTTAFYDIDTPITLARLADGTCTYLTHDLVPRFDMYLSFTGGPTLRRIEAELGAKRALPLYCAVDPVEYAPELRPMRWGLGYMGTYSEDRQPALRTLLLEPAYRLTEARFIVAGPQYPPEIEWPANVVRVEHIPPRDHRRFYAELGFALNLTRADMIAAGWSPSVRLFEAAACGTPVISDSWHGLDELFELGDELLIAEDADDVVRYLHDVSEGERRAIGARACARVRASHTAAHRAADLERYASRG